jgi:hypothetical protein
MHKITPLFVKQIAKVTKLISVGEMVFGVMQKMKPSPERMGRRQYSQYSVLRSHHEVNRGPRSGRQLARQAHIRNLMFLL